MANNQDEELLWAKADLFDELRNALAGFVMLAQKSVPPIAVLMEAESVLQRANKITEASNGR